MIVQNSLLEKKKSFETLFCYLHVKFFTSLGLKTPQEAHGNAKDTIFNNKVNLNYILILDPGYLLIISLKTAYLSLPKSQIKIRSILKRGSLGTRQGCQ